MNRKRLAAAGLVTLGALAAAQKASPAQYPPGPTVVVSPSPAEPGATVTVSGAGCGEPGTPVTVTVAGGSSASTSTGPGGNYRVNLTAPTEPGIWSVDVSCDGRSASALLQVRAAGDLTGSSTGALPVTGSNDRNLVAAGVCLVAAGGVLFVVSQRRRSRSVQRA